MVPDFSLYWITVPLGLFVLAMAVHYEIKKNKRIAALEAKSKLPRLTATQKNDLAIFFREHKGWNARVQWIDSKSKRLAADFAEVFKAAGWPIFCSDYKGPRKGFLNVVVCVPTKNEMAFAEQVVQRLIRSQVAAASALSSDSANKTLTLVLGQDIDTQYQPD